MTKQFYTKNDDGEYVEVEALSKTAVDNLIDGRLKRQQETKFGDYEELKEKALEAEKLRAEFDTKLKEASDKASELEKELTNAKLDTTRVKLMSEFKLNDDMAEFVIGEDEAEMRRRAEKLAEKAPKQQITIEKSGTGDDKKSTGNQELAKKLFGQSDD